VRTSREKIFLELQTIAGHPSRFAVALILSLSLISAGCAASAKSQLFFGKTDPPRDNVLRYVSGSEPESLDPAISVGQPEARIYMALYEGLVEYDPRTTAPVPALAERWKVNNDSSELTFYLRHNGRFSNGEGITAGDFVYSIRRGLSPQLASHSAGLAYYIKYAEAYNAGAVFVQDPSSGKFLLAGDFDEGGNRPAQANADPKAAVAPPKTSGPLSSQPLTSVGAEYPPIPEDKIPDADTPFHQFMHSPAR